MSRWRRLCILGLGLPVAFGAAGGTLLQRALDGSAALEDITNCGRRAVVDLQPVLARIASGGGPQDSGLCDRVVRQLYCESVLDAFLPWPFENRCGTASTEQEGHSMHLMSEGVLGLAFIVFMVDEVEAVQQLLAYMAPNDSALVHVDLRQAAAHTAMLKWAASRPRVLIRSRWAVVREGYSAGAALLEMLDLAVHELPPWDFALFLSGAHFPIRPRQELVRFLWYQPLSFVGSEEGLTRFERFKETRHHLQLGFECAGDLFDPLWNGSGESIALPGLGHPNITAAHGPPFAVLRRDFVEWLSAERLVKGSPAWVLVRHSLRTWCSVEKLFQTLMLNTEWCDKASFRHDLTLARQAPEEQELHHPHGLQSSSSEGKAVMSAKLLLARDLPDLIASRAGHWVESGFPGVSGTGGDWSLSPAFAAFARKVDPGLRALLSQGPAFEVPSWESWDGWPLAARAWELMAPCGSPADGPLLGQRRSCGQVGDRAPCAVELTLARPGCSVALRVQERVGVGLGRVFAVQVGSSWNPAVRVFGDPGLVSARHAVRAEFFAAVRRHQDLQHELRVRALFFPPKGQAFLVEPAFDLRQAKSGGSVTFQRPDHAALEPGEWHFVLEAIADRDVHSPLPGTVLARRPFYVYGSENEVTLDVMQKYFHLTFVPLAE